MTGLYKQVPNLNIFVRMTDLPNNNSGALYQKVTTTGSRSAKGFNGELNNLAKPMSAIFTRPRSGPEST
jgi:hypothetical protein